MRHAVLFDMDGVLCDSEPIINAAAIAYFKERGHTVQPEDFLPFVGAGENRYIGGVAEKYEIPIEIETAKARTYELYFEMVRDHLQPLPGAVELVLACRAAGMKVAVASSADWAKVEANLREIELPPKDFDAVITAEDAEHKKPAPDIFLAGAKKLGLEPDACVVIEDSLHGVEAAHGAGMPCVAVVGSFARDRLADADRIVDELTELTPADLQAL